MNSIKILSTDDFEVMSSVDPGKASGSDGIPDKLFSECAHELAPSLTAIFNSSIMQGKVPSDWKLANINLVFKKGEKSCVVNYRLISLLSLVFKVLEWCIYKQHVTSIHFLEASYCPVPHNWAL